MAVVGGDGCTQEVRVKEQARASCRVLSTQFAFSGTGLSTRVATCDMHDSFSPEAHRYLFYGSK